MNQDSFTKDLIARFNEQYFDPHDAEGSLESGPDFNFPLFEATGKVDDDWIEVRRSGRGNYDDQFEWIKEGVQEIEIRENPDDPFLPI